MTLVPMLATIACTAAIADPFPAAAPLSIVVAVLNRAGWPYTLDQSRTELTHGIFTPLTFTANDRALRAFRLHILTSLPLRITRCQPANARFKEAIELLTLDR